MAVRSPPIPNSSFTLCCTKNCISSPRKQTHLRSLVNDAVLEAAVQVLHLASAGAAQRGEHDLRLGEERLLQSKPSTYTRDCLYFLSLFLLRFEACKLHQVTYTHLHRIRDIVAWRHNFPLLNYRCVGNDEASLLNVCSPFFPLNACSPYVLKRAAFFQELS